MTISFLFFEDVFNNALVIFFDFIHIVIDFINYSLQIQNKILANNASAEPSNSSELPSLSDAFSKAANATWNTFFLFFTNLFSGKPLYPSTSVSFTHFFQVLIFVIPGVSTVLYSIDTIRRCGIRVELHEEENVTNLSELIDKALITGDIGSWFETVQLFIYHLEHSSDKFIISSKEFITKYGLSAHQDVASLITLLESNKGIELGIGMIFVYISIIWIFTVTTKIIYDPQADGRNVSRTRRLIINHPSITHCRLPGHS